jgi:hypothetical protein
MQFDFGLDSDTVVDMIEGLLVVVVGDGDVSVRP